MTEKKSLLVIVSIIAHCQGGNSSLASIPEVNSSLFIKSRKSLLKKKKIESEKKREVLRKVLFMIYAKMICEREVDFSMWKLYLIFTVKPSKRLESHVTVG